MLKKIRVITAIIFFFLISAALYFDFAVEKMGFIQFGPMLLRKSDGDILLLMLGLIVPAGAALLFGRVYCSFICPVGIMQDIWMVSPKYKPRPLKKKLAVFRYTLFFLVMSGLAVSISLPLSLIEPFSIFGRIINILVRPLVSAVNNVIYTYGGSVILKPLRIPEVSLWITGFMLLFFMALMITSLLFGRVFCNTLCPVGLFMGIFSRNPFLAVRINSDKCFGCGKCEKKCPAGCIDSGNKTINTERCVSCMNCIDSCPAGVIKYETKPKEKDLSRRKFLLEAGGMVAAIGVTLAPKIAAAPIENRTQNTPFIPPGAVNLSRFDGTCTACHLCVGVCPTKILKPAGIEYGFMRIFKPYMDYKQGFCQFECKKCSEVCPVRAITPMTIEKKKTIKLGNVILDKPKCIVYKENKNCGACSEHCPTKAVFMEEVSKGIYGPETDNSICIGCGACQHVCPVTPKAIYLEPLTVHKQAAVRSITKDKEVEEREKAAQSEDFPF